MFVINSDVYILTLFIIIYHYIQVRRDTRAFFYDNLFF